MDPVKPPRDRRARQAAATRVRIIEAAATYAADDNVRDRVRFATDTCAKRAAEKPASGLPALAAAKGDDVVTWLTHLFPEARKEKSRDDRLSEAVEHLQIRREAERIVSYCSFSAAQIRATPEWRDVIEPRR